MVDGRDGVKVQGTAQQMSTRPRRPLRRYGVSLCLVAVLQLANLSIFGPFAPQQAPQRAEARLSTFPYTDVNPYGANTFLSKEVEDWKREKTVQYMSEAGLGWMKQQFPWSEIEPKPGRFWDDKYNQDSWAKYDRIVELAEKHGVRVIARLDNTPDWARGPNTTQQTPPSDYDRFADFVAQFVTHYKGRVQYLQIWNEPNLKQEWGGTLDPVGYATMLRKVHAKAKAIDPDIVILSAPLAQTLEQGDRGLNDLTFLQQLYDAGFANSFDIMMANGYGFNLPPTAPPDPQVLNLRRIELLRQIMERNGDTAKPVWLNEYAWNAAPADFPPEKVQWRRVTPEQQAAYTVEGIRFMREHWPWLGVVNIWYFRQVGDVPLTEGEHYFRMVDPEFTTQPVYREVARATDLQRLALPGRYSALSPSLAAKGRWKTLRPDATTAVKIRSDRPGDTVKITFQGNVLTLDALKGPDGGRLGVQVDGSTDAVQALSRDDKGRRYIDLRAPSVAAETFTVVSGLDPLAAAREHEVTLTSLPNGDGTNGSITITAVDVAYSRSSAVFLLVSLLTALLAATVVVGVVRALGRLRPLREAT